MCPQALYEIGAQALRATPSGGRIQIRLERHEGNARVSVEDCRHVDKADGAPVVLAGDAAPLDPLTLRSTIERQGGRFDTVPADAARGMRYVIELPLQAIAAPEPVAVPQAPDPATDQPLLSGLTVMCIDDHADALEALATMLGVEGARVRAFHSGRAPLEWLAHQPQAQWPQLLVCDISLGDEEDGHQVMRRLRQIEAQRGVPLDRRLPAIALTGWRSPRTACSR